VAQGAWLWLLPLLLLAAAAAAANATAWSCNSASGHVEPWVAAVVAPGSTLNRSTYRQGRKTRNLADFAADLPDGFL